LQVAHRLSNTTVKRLLNYGGVFDDDKVNKMMLSESLLKSCEVVSSALSTMPAILSFA